MPGGVTCWHRGNTRSQSQAGVEPTALCSTDQTGWGISPPAKVNFRPPTGLTLKSAGLKNLIYPLFPQDIILKLLLQDILFNNLLLLQKEGSVKYWLHTSVM